MKPSSFFHSTTWNRSFLSLLLVILSLGVFAQTNELVRYDFGMFSIMFPESCQKIETESDEEQGCSGWVTPTKTLSVLSAFSVLMKDSIPNNVSGKKLKDLILT